MSWNSGSQLANLSFGPTSKDIRSISRFAETLVWVSITPLGSLPDPDVYWTRGEVFAARLRQKIVPGP